MKRKGTFPLITLAVLGLACSFAEARPSPKPKASAQKAAIARLLHRESTQGISKVLGALGRLTQQVQRQQRQISHLKGALRSLRKKALTRRLVLKAQVEKCSGSYHTRVRSTPTAKSRSVCHVTLALPTRALVVASYSGYGRRVTGGGHCWSYVRFGHEAPNSTTSQRSGANFIGGSYPVAGSRMKILPPGRHILHLELFVPAGQTCMLNHGKMHAFALPLAQQKAQNIARTHAPTSRPTSSPARTRIPSRAPASQPSSRPTRSPARAHTPASQPSSRPTSSPAATSRPKRRSRLARILKTRQIRACVRTDMPPLGYLHRGQLRGLDIDLTRALVAHLSHKFNAGLKIRWTTITAAQRITKLRKEECDLVVAAFSYTRLRARYVRFSELYLKTDRVLVSRSKITRRQPIIAVARGTTAPTQLRGRFRYFRTHLQLLSAMVKGQADYAVVPRPMARYMLRLQKTLKLVQVLRKGSEQYAIAANKKDAALLKEIDEALARLAGSGALAALRRKWL